MRGLLGIVAAVVVAGAIAGGVWRWTRAAVAPAAETWSAPPADFVGRWTVTHPGGSLWYMGEYAAADGGESPTVPVGRHYVYRPGLVQGPPGDPRAEAVLKAVVEELDFTDTPSPALDRAWRPAAPGENPKAPPGLTGRWFVFHPDGSRRFAGAFVDGRPHGLQAMWDEEGALFENTLVDGVRQGPARAFYPDETLRNVGHYENDLLEGPMRHFAPDGRLVRVDRYKNGKLTGESTQYGPSGRVALVEHYLDGYKDGLRSIYDDEGRLRQQVTFELDVQSGPFTEFHPNGRPKMVGAFKDGQLDGWLEEFDDAGNSTARKHYREGVEVDAGQPDWVAPEATSRRVEPDAAPPRDQ